MTETLPTLSTMERVLFLRKVPLFSALPPPDLEPSPRSPGNRPSRTATRSPSKGSPVTRCSSS